jgi:hypothetical protein
MMRTTTTTITIIGPDVGMGSLSSERQSYRPGEYIGLIMVFKNVGEAGYVNKYTLSNKCAIFR